MKCVRNSNRNMFEIRIETCSNSRTSNRKMILEKYCDKKNFLAIIKAAPDSANAKPKWG